MQVIGVAPSGFRGMEVGQEALAFVPLAMKRSVTPTWDELESRRAMWLTPVARLKPGITMEQAQVRANYLASPPLVGACALAGKMQIDLTSEPLGTDLQGQPV